MCYEYLSYKIKIYYLINFCNYIYLNSTPGTKFYFDTTIPAIEAFTERSEADFLYKLGLSASSNRMVGLMSLAPVAARSWTNMAPHAERAPGRDIHTGQAPSSATDTGGLSGKAKEVDDANLPSEKKKNQKLTP
ncbi:BnaCnng08260D [Brassica napus]|uniref:BnaCnng08260D protein n=1 Tax=Brassica napus TaxID=3708 RepID=A0A078HHB6_BRANA|nr:BnaCnng08260D [Brassica napus]